MTNAFEHHRGQGHVRGVGCRLVAHYTELQALCDALAHAAQMEMADAIERDDALGRERAYGKWLALRGLLRGIEGRVDEWTATERAMLTLIDWSREQFRFLGIEKLEQPGSEPGPDGSAG